MMANSNFLVSCDPGLSGALAIFDISESPALVKFIDTPVTARGKTTKNKIDCEALCRVLWAFEDLVSMFALEAVHSMPSQGVSSSFNFGHSYGVAEMLGHAIGSNRVELITPQAWKKHFGLIGTEKDEARVLALGLFPHMADSLCKKKNSGRADAALIGQFAIECLLKIPNSQFLEPMITEQPMELSGIKYADLSLRTSGSGQSQKKANSKKKPVVSDSTGGFIVNDCFIDSHGS